MVRSARFDSRLQDPRAPEIVARVPVAAHRLDVKEADGTVYLYSVNAEPDVYDLGDPSAPRLLGAVPASASWDLHAPVAAAGDKLYVAAGGTGFVVMDDPRTDPSSATIDGIYVESSGDYSHHAGLFEVEGTTYALHNDEIGPESWYKIIDVTPGSPSFLEVMSEYKTTTGQVSHNVTMDGTIAYLAYYQHGVRVLDVADPVNPVELGYFHTFDIDNALLGSDGAVDIAVDSERGLIFVADTPRGLVILRRTP